MIETGTRRLFVYGELCKPAVLVAELGRVSPMRPAILSGYRRNRIPSTGYYQAARQNGATIVGLLIDGLTDADLEHLDVYENVARNPHPPAGWRRDGGDCGVAPPPRCTRHRVVVASCTRCHRARHKHHRSCGTEY